MSPEPNDGFITLARVVKTQGRHGEVAVEVHSDVPDRFTESMKLQALDRSEGRRELQVESLWPHKGLLVLKFRGIDSITDAEGLIGSELQVPRVERSALEQGWTYVSGQELGTIEDVQFGAGEAPLLIVASKMGKKFDVPFAEAYLETVDTTRKQVRMKLPEGLLDINAPMTAEEKQQQKREA